jgi:hypothetical protein
MDIGLLILRLVVGLTLAAHGAPKAVWLVWVTGWPAPVASSRSRFPPGQAEGFLAGSARFGGVCSSPRAWPRPVAPPR